MSPANPAIVDVVTRGALSRKPPKDIPDYRRRCWEEYKDSIGYPSSLTYLYGNPISALVPVETATDGLMIVGAYPSARFGTVNGVADVPLYDNISPFSTETYFDGSRVRTVLSGRELDEVILAQIGVPRKRCWITDLVKVFLFKPGHVARYEKQGKGGFAENRSKFMDYARYSLWWLQHEIRLAQPRGVLLLGAEVTRAVFDVSDTIAKQYMDGAPRNASLLKNDVDVLAFPHPGILMRNTPGNSWPDAFKNTIAPRARKHLKSIGL